MRALLNQLRTRLILGALLFLLALTGAVVLVVRDSLVFAARNVATLGEQAMLAQGRAALLEITRREAELSEAAVRADAADLTRVNQRLGDLRLTPNTFGFVVDNRGTLIMPAPALVLA